MLLIRSSDAADGADADGGGVLPPAETPRASCQLTLLTSPARVTRASHYGDDECLFTVAVYILNRGCFDPMEDKFPAFSALINAMLWCAAVYGVLTDWESGEREAFSGSQAPIHSHSYY